MEKSCKWNFAFAIFVTTLKYGEVFVVIDMNYKFQWLRKKLGKIVIDSISEYEDGRKKKGDEISTCISSTQECQVVSCGDAQHGPRSIEMWFL